MKLLFVCLGNICRSPAGEGIMNKMLESAQLDLHIFCDSAGTSAYHTGEFADARMQEHAKQRGYKLTSRSRQFVYGDFKEFDWIFAMDHSNYHDILSLDTKDQYKGKVYLITDFCRNIQADGVPDPYYGGAEGFEHVIDILEDACRHVLEKIQGSSRL